MASAVVGFGPDTALELLDLIEHDTNRRLQRELTPLTETQLNGMAVVSVDELPQRTGLLFMAAEDFLPAAPSTEERVMVRLNQISDPRLEAVMGGLDPTEAAVVWAHGMTQVSWETAAQTCGLAASEGERVRAKLHRHVRRILLAGPSASRTRIGTR